MLIEEHNLPGFWAGSPVEATCAKIFFNSVLIHKGAVAL